MTFGSEMRVAYGASLKLPAPRYQAAVSRHLKLYQAQHTHNW